MPTPSPMNPLGLPRHTIHRRPWQPLTDAEYAALLPFLPHEGGRGRPTDRRKTLNAIFWVACSRGPWRELPSHLGKAETAARALRRWARRGFLERLLLAVSNHPLGGGTEALRGLAWYICRAFRRMSRLLGEEAVQLAARLRLVPALPALHPAIPNPILSETVQSLVDQDLARLRTAPRAEGLALIERLKLAHRVLQQCAGNRRKWRLK
ncbi:MAG TPA: transposase [Salinarimonas sp.]|nr:transposase [Salinarimonas sp.]